MGDAIVMRIFSSKLILAVCMVILPVVFISTGFAGEARYYITQDGAGKKDGSSWENSASDLKGFMDCLEEEASIWVAAGTYSPGVESDDSFILKKGLKLYGGFAGAETKIDERDAELNATVLSGGKISRKVAVVTAVGKSLSDDTCLDGFTITGGMNVQNGGGIYVDIFGSPLINQCIVTDNVVYDYGGGMYNYYSSPLILNCTFSGNQSLNEGGGGVYNHCSSPVIKNCFFLSNKSYSHGGGMLSYAGIFKVFDSTFSGNKSSFRGGGMSSYSSTVEIKDCVFDENKGEEYGGGVHNEESFSSISNCVFSNNETTPGNGGGVANVDSSVKITGSKFLANTANYYGGGISNFNSSLEISGCVLAENRAMRFGGGGIVNWLSTMNMNNCQISGNVSNAGGGIYNNNSSSVIEYSVFSNNKAKKNNDIEDENSKSTLKNCLISEEN